jgi:tRNA dimethylallyltransferase
MADLVGEDYPLVVILGPTASGKSALAVGLGERFEGEIVNYDSVQIYRGFDIGTGKTPPHERRGIPHHLLDIAAPTDDFTAGDYRGAALEALQSLRARNRLPILVGGTGLYLRSLLLGLFEGPRRSQELRARLRALAEGKGKRGDYLHRLLRRLDPPTAARIHPRDTQKIIRALEVCLLARQPMSAMLERGRERLRGFRRLKIGLNPERASLCRRLDQRVKQMFAAGLMDEARAAATRPEAPNIKVLGALGYRQACAALRGEISEEEAIRQTQSATRRYAKRQMTWFRREPHVTWFAGFGDDPEVQHQVVDWLRRRLL